MASVVRYLMKTKVFVYLSKSVVSKVNFRVFGKPQFSVRDLEHMHKAIQLDAAQNPESIYCFVCCDDSALSSILIKFFTRSRWGHAGFIDYSNGISGNVGVLPLIHMTLDNIKRESSKYFIGKVDRVAICRFTFRTEFDVERAKKSIYSALKANATYDFSHELTSKAVLDCSELLFNSMRKLLVQAPNSDYYTRIRPSKRLGLKMFTPDDVYKSASKVIWELKE